MLKPEAAQEKLKSFTVENWGVERQAAVGKLPGHLREPAEVVLGDHHFWSSPERRDRQKIEMTAAQQLDEMGPGDRLAVFNALFPKIAKHVDRAWSLLVTVPYQRGYFRKPFRAPNTPATSRRARFDWLGRLKHAVNGYDQDVTWLAVWAPFLSWDAPEALGILFAAAIDGAGGEGDAVFDVLCASARGEHEIGAMGRHVTRGLLLASREDGWDFVERLLLAAQMQEGLRQVILETIDEAHPQAFRRMLRLILDHNLARFSATVRAIDVWLGFSLDSAEARRATELVATIARLLDDRQACLESIENGDGLHAYLGLWALGFADAGAAVEPASQLLADRDVERRFAGAHLLTNLGLAGAIDALLPALDDADLRVATRLIAGLRGEVDQRLKKGDLFEGLERVLPRFPRQTTVLHPGLSSLVFVQADRSDVVRLLIESLGDRPPVRLLSHLSAMESYHRGRVAALLVKQKQWDAETRNALFSFVGDQSSEVRAAALTGIANCKVDGQEAMSFERLLSRTASDLRRGVISLLLNQPDEAALASAERLLEASDQRQRQAGLELLRELKTANRQPERSGAIAERFQATRRRLGEVERRLLDDILTVARPTATIEDALGLLDPAQRTKPEPPKTKKGLFFKREQPSLVTSAAAAFLQSLDLLVSKHRTTTVPVSMWEGDNGEDLLGNADWRFPRTKLEIPIAEDVARLPLQEIWTAWWNERPAETRDRDGFELLRALASFSATSYHIDRTDNPDWLKKARKALFVDIGELNLQYRKVVANLLDWLLRLYPPADAADFLLDAVEFSATLLPTNAVPKADEDAKDETRESNLLGWLDFARFHRKVCPAAWEDAHHARLWRYLRWIDEPVPGARRQRPSVGETMAAFQVGAATEADVLDLLLGPRPRGRYGWGSFSALHDLTRRKPSPLLEQYPALPVLVDRCRERIVEVELTRGDLPTAASSPAVDLRSAGGLETLVPVLRAFGREDFVRGWMSDKLSKASVFSHLVRVTYPAETDTPEAFTAMVTGIPAQRLTQLALYAPQWASHVEHALAWPGLSDAALWILAHTKDSQWHVEQEIREIWAAEIAERTPVPSHSLLDGAVDVAWFNRSYQALGLERWDQVYDAAKFASGGGGHERARRFADAMLGRVTKSELIAKIVDKRHQDTVRSLGLLPLAEGEGREADLLERYGVIQEFLRTSRQFGAQRQESEKLAATIGLENLARTAGYRDPLRLQWAMEARTSADLAEGPLIVSVGDVAVALAIDDFGAPHLTVAKGGRPLKSIPAAAKKDPAVIALRAKQREVRQQGSRVRLSLEQAMCRGDSFSGAELRELFGHAVLAPMLRGLVFIGEGIIGYPIERGLALESPDGTISPVGESETLRIAHAYDLLTTGEWPLWQRECFARERIQPFKQVFRELYVLTRTEQEDGTLSRRYAGHQVQPRKAMALLGQRSWVNHPDEGVRRTFHDAGLSAWLNFLEGTFTPADVEGLTIEGVGFSRYGEWKRLSLTDVPPRLFSEVMRDVDLVVSVAHRGGVDPEATASTVEMRASLIRETCALLKIVNVRLEGAHALIEGGLRSYSVHLGSAVAHQQPGGALCIVPVHAQHRGRIFLPFADDDPKTAEVLSKILLLARDTEIKDPTVLEQILA